MRLTEIIEQDNFQDFWDAVWSGHSHDFIDTIIKYVPEFKYLVGVPQNPKWHPEGDCDIHVCFVIDNVANLKDKDMTMAAIFHDMGKPETTRQNPKTGQPSAFGHENVSMKYVDRYKQFIEDCGCNFEKIKGMVGLHMRMHQYNSNQLVNPAKRERMESLPYFDDLKVFAKADHDMPGL